MDALHKIHARDLMQSDVLRLAPDDPVGRAIELLEEHGVTGAPVESPDGRLVGMFSNTDVARVEHVSESRIATDGRPVRLALRDGEDERDEEEFESGILAAADDDAPVATARAATVADWMSRSVVHVAPQATLKVVCATLARHSIHRVPVVEDGRLRGTVSTLDIVERLAREL